MSEGAHTRPDKRPPDIAAPIEQAPLEAREPAPNVAHLRDVRLLEFEIRDDLRELVLHKGAVARLVADLVSIEVSRNE
jgi:hypothetical protein